LYFFFFSFLPFCFLPDPAFASDVEDSVVPASASGSAGLAFNFRSGFFVILVFFSAFFLLSLF